MQCGVLAFWALFTITILHFCGHLPTFYASQKKVGERDFLHVPFSSLHMLLSDMHMAKPSACHRLYSHMLSCCVVVMVCAMPVSLPALMTVSHASTMHYLFYLQTEEKGGGGRGCKYRQKEKGNMLLPREDMYSIHMLSLITCSHAYMKKGRRRGREEEEGRRKSYLIYISGKGKIYI